MLKKLVITTAAMVLFAFSAIAQMVNESDEYNPIFDTQSIPIDKRADKDGKESFFEVDLRNISSTDSFYRSFWQNEISRSRGYFFVLEGSYKMPNGVVVAFSQLRSNVTCANYGYYTKPNEGSEKCYMRMILLYPDYSTTAQFDNIWMNGYADKIYIKPEANKKFLDILIGDLWFEYSQKQRKYILSPKNNIGGEK